MPTMNISLTPELMQRVQAKVASGLYNNASEVIREAIRLLDQNAEAMYQHKLNELKKILEPRLAKAKNGKLLELSADAINQKLNKRRRKS
jgi:antitoxin ParD1/3/4